MLFQYIALILVGITMSIPYNKDDLTGRIETDLAMQSEATNEERTSNKDFWDNIYQNSILNTKTKYNTVSGEKVCFTCPIDRSTFTSLFHQAAKSANTPGEAPPRITIAWSTQLSENRMIFFCRNNTRMSSAPIYLGSDNENGQQADFGTIRTSGGGDGGELDYSCENDRLCLINLRHNYPENYQCLVKSYVLNVRLNVIGKFFRLINLLLKEDFIKHILKYKKVKKKFFYSTDYLDYKQPLYQVLNNTFIKKMVKKRDDSSSFLQPFKSFSNEKIFPFSF